VNGALFCVLASTAQLDQSQVLTYAAERRAHRRAPRPGQAPVNVICAPGGQVIGQASTRTGALMTEQDQALRDHSMRYESTEVYGSVQYDQASGYDYEPAGYSVTETGSTI
jgi:hypothetical protein